MKNDRIISPADGIPAESKKSNANIGVLKRSLRKQAKDKYWNYKPKDAIDGPMDSNIPPKEGYHFEFLLLSWVPKSFDMDAFNKEKDAVIEAEYQRSLDITPNPNNPGFSLSGKALSMDSEPKDDESSIPCGTSGKSVKQEQQYTGIAVAPDSTPPARIQESDERPPQKSSYESDMEALSPITSEGKSEPAADIEESGTVTSKPQPEAVEQSKKTRRSSKMVESDFDTLAAQFICPTDLAEKKPLFFPERIRESLRKIAGLVPGGKVSPSHIAIHVIEAWINEHRDLFNRMFANQKTSI